MIRRQRNAFAAALLAVLLCGAPAQAKQATTFRELVQAARRMSQRFAKDRQLSLLVVRNPSSPTDLHWITSLPKHDGRPGELAGLMAQRAKVAIPGGVGGLPAAARTLARKAFHRQGAVKEVEVKDFVSEGKRFYAATVSFLGSPVAEKVVRVVAMMGESGDLLFQAAD